MSEARVVELVERAFDYRGYVTVTRHDGTKVVGFVYDRGDAHVHLLDERAVGRIQLAIDDIADLAFTGEDSAEKARRSWERRRGEPGSSETSAWGDWEERTTLILVALPIELRAVATALGATIRGATARGWLGDERATALAVGVGGGAAHAIAAERPGLVISCGFAGALDPSLAPGDLVLASSVCDENGETFATADSVLHVARLALAHHRHVAQGELVCATSIAATSDEKRALARPGRTAVDLESWAVARAARRAGIPWLALRVVLDPLDVDLPEFTRDVGAWHTARAMRHALGGPLAAVDLVRLGVRARKANRSLARALRGLAPVLGQLGQPRISR